MLNCMRQQLWHPVSQIKMVIFCFVPAQPERIWYVRMGDQKVPSADLDQIHLPDPVLNDIRQLQTDNIRLKKELKALKEKLAKEKIIEEA